MEQKRPEKNDGRVRRVEQTIGGSDGIYASLTTILLQRNDLPGFSF